MTPPSNCPFNTLTAAPCHRCRFHNADMDTCGLSHTASASSATYANPETYAERLRRYEEEREKLLGLSKESLVDLILHRPAMI